MCCDYWTTHDNGEIRWSPMICYVDSPSTTSATVYTIKWRGDGNTLYLNRIGGGTNQAGTSQLNTIEILA